MQHLSGLGIALRQRRKALFWLTTMMRNAHKAIRLKTGRIETEKFFLSSGSILSLAAAA
jgi:hypothetical protein